MIRDETRKYCGMEIYTHITHIHSKNFSFPCTRRTLLEKKKGKWKENKQHRQYSMEFNCPGREGWSILPYS